MSDRPSNLILSKERSSKARSAMSKHRNDLPR